MDRSLPPRKVRNDLWKISQGVKYSERKAGKIKCHFLTPHWNRYRSTFSISPFLYDYIFRFNFEKGGLVCPAKWSIKLNPSAFQWGDHFDSFVEGGLCDFFRPPGVDYSVLLNFLADLLSHFPYSSIAHSLSELKVISEGSFPEGPAHRLFPFIGVVIGSYKHCRVKRGLDVTKQFILIIQKYIFRNIHEWKSVHSHYEIIVSQPLNVVLTECK